MESEKAPTVSRKTVYSFFLVAFALIFFVMVYWASFQEALSVKNPEMGVKGTKAELKMEILNYSKHFVRGITVVVMTSGNSQSFPVEDLNAGQVAYFSQILDIPSDLTYFVEVRAPFNKTISIEEFTLKSEVVDPLKAEVSLSGQANTEWQMVVGQEYLLTKNICNRSEEALPSIEWTESVSGNYFKEALFPNVFSLSPKECKPITTTLTPTSSGFVTINFNVKVGDFEKSTSKQIKIVPEN
ncbi:MAG: hypothetical protein WC308_01130 [archaeon]|jgi:hypothetical protein